MLRMINDLVHKLSALQKDVKLPIGVNYKVFREPLAHEGAEVVSVGQKVIMLCNNCWSCVNLFPRFI